VQPSQSLKDQGDTHLVYSPALHHAGDIHDSLVDSRVIVVEVDEPFANRSARYVAYLVSAIC